MSFFKPSNPALSVDFPDQQKPHTAGEQVGGLVHLRLDRDSDGKLEFESLTGKLRVMMKTTAMRYNHHNKRQERRTEKTMLYGNDIVIWNSSHHGTDLQAAISLPFGFVLPAAQNRLPPSFEGGDRSSFGGRPSVLGHSLCKVVWSIKITARKSSMFSRNERMVFPFLYFQPPLQTWIPPQIFPPPGPSGILPPYPPAPPPASSGFKTLVLSQTQRTNGFFSSKKGKLLVRFSIPSSPTFPSFHPIPYHISILVFSHPLSEKFSPSSSSPPPELDLPSPSALRLQLTRQVSSRAHGATDVIDQKAGDLVELSKENRVWFGEKMLMADPEEGGTHRWGAEITIVGEFVLGTGPTTGCGQTVWPETTGGLLSSHFFVDLSLPMKGLRNDLKHDQLLSFAITSPLPTTSAAPPLYTQKDLFPPGYLQSGDDSDDDGK